MLRVSVVKGSRLVTLPDYDFVIEHIDLLEKLSLLCPKHPIRIRELNGRVHNVEVSSLHVDKQEVFKLNAEVVI